MDNEKAIPEQTPEDRIKRLEKRIRDQRAEINRVRLGSIDTARAWKYRMNWLWDLVGPEDRKNGLDCLPIRIRMRHEELQSALAASQARVVDLENQCELYRLAAAKKEPEPVTLTISGNYNPDNWCGVCGRYNFIGGPHA